MLRGAIRSDLPPVPPPHTLPPKQKHPPCQGLERIIKRVDALDRELMKFDGAPKTTVETLGTDGKKKTSGGPSLTVSAAYPIGFGAALGLVFHETYILTYQKEEPAWTLLLLQELEINCEVDDGECFADFQQWRC